MLLARLPVSESFVDSVRWAISEGLRGGNLGVEAIAKRLGYAPRTLQGKLQEDGTSHQELLDEMRREPSFHYLREEHIAVILPALSRRGDWGLRYR